MPWRKNRRKTKPVLSFRDKLMRRRPTAELLEARQVLSGTSGPFGYLQVPLAADQTGSALVQDPNLQNAWGLVEAPNGGPLWVVDGANGVASRYQGAVTTGGTISPFNQLTQNISLPAGASTAIAFNPTFDFSVGTGNDAAPPLFFIASQSGEIDAWQSLLNAQAQKVISVNGADFTGLAVANNGSSSLLYAADFHNGTIDVFDSSYNQTTLAANAFTDSSLPAGYAPYNIQLIGNQLYVTYALQNASKDGPQPGGGNGAIDVYSLNGSLVTSKLVSGGNLNVPDGLAMAPSGFGDFAGDLLVANSGNGEILAYNTSGVFQGALNNGPGDTSPIIVSGIRGLQFGNGSTAGDATGLFYSAANGGHGQVGEILNAFDQTLAVVPGVVTATQGTATSVTMAVLNDVSPNQTASDFTAEINWGDGTSNAATLVADPNGGYNVKGTHTYAAAGTYSSVVTVSDSANNSRTATATANVIDTSFSPAGVTLTTTEAQLFGGTVGSFLDTSGSSSAGQYSASINWGDGSSSAGTVALASSGSGFDVTGSHTYTQGGTFSVTATILEKMAGSATAGSSPIGTIASTAAVTDLNTLTPHASTFSATQGTKTSVAVATFTDNYAAATAGIFQATVDWGDGTTASIGSVTLNNGTFTVLGSHAFVENGPMSVTVTVTDTPGSVDATVVSTANVADGNTLTVQPMTVVAQPGQTFTGNVATFADANSLVRASDFSAQIDWGDGKTTAGTVAAANGTLTVAGSHSYATGGVSDPVVVSVTENAHTTIAYPTATSTAIVPANDVAGSGATVSATASVASSPQTLATFSPNTGNLATTFTATIDWGDGSSFTAGTVTTDASGGFKVIGSHTYATPGVYTPDVIVYEATATGGATPAAAITASATAASPVVMTTATVVGTEHTTLTYTVATFTDADNSVIASDFTATVNWGDGNTSAGTITGSNGHFSVVGSHAFADAGTMSVAVNLSETAPITLSSSVTSTATVSQDDTLTAVGASLTTTIGSTFSGTVATFTDTDTLSASNNFTAVISWGDGNDSAGTVSGGNGTFTVNGVHAYTQDGGLPLKVTLQNNSSLPGSTESIATGTAAVSPGSAFTATGTSISSTEGQTFSGTVATFSDTGSTLTASAFTAMVNWGDGTSSTATVTGASGAFTVAGSHSYTANGTFQAAVSITETAVNAIIAATTSATVSDANTLTPVASTVTATAGTTFTGTVAKFDDTFTGVSASDFTATIDWGDGSSATVGSVTASNGTLSVVGSHAYTAAGSDTITVDLSENSPGTASSTATSSATVVTASSTSTSTPTPTTTGTISGEVFNDYNVNGKLDSGEPGLSGRTVFLNVDGSGVPDSSNPSTTTDANGNYSFTGLQPGSYSVMEVVSPDHGDTLTTSAQTVTVAAGENVSGINIGNVLTSTITPLQVSLTGPPASTDANTAYINAVYQSILGHAADATGLAYWQQQLAGGTSRASLAQGVWDSQEHLGDEVEQFYEEFLGRPSDPVGKAFWIAAFSSWGTDQIEVEGFLTSTEFMNLHSGETAFVDALYSDVDQRAADSAGESYWVGQMAAGSTPLQVASAFVFGQEAATNLVDSFYSDFLHRAPSSSELQTWVSDITSKALTADQVAVQILSSSEYYNNATGNHAPSILSADSTSFTVGSAGSFTVSTSGMPAPTLSESGNLPSGVTFTDNGNGTATLAGTAATGTGGTYDLTISASNSAGTAASQTFVLTIDEAPSITSATATTFTAGSAGTFKIATSGTPLATITEVGTLPTGVTFTDNGDGTATLGGTAGAGGTYDLTINASNGIGTAASQTLVLTVDAAPAITSTPSALFSAGTAGTFKVTTTGVPTAALTETGTLPSGVTFTDNGDGTATVASTTAAAAGTYPFTINATNGIGTAAMQSFTLTIGQAPAITSATTDSFTAGTTNSFKVTTSGSPTATISESGSLPGGVTFVDNGDGTATLSGVPDTSSTGSYSITLTASNGTTPDATQTFTLTVNAATGTAAPAITSATSTTFATGSVGNFTVTTTGDPTPALTESGNLPSGVTFVDNANGTAAISGTPAAGTTGSYPITITAASSTTPNATQTFTLTVSAPAAPSFTSADSASFATGTAGTFTVKTTGSPTPVITESGSLPSGLTFVDNHDGTATISGTPAAGSAGTYALSLKAASNGVSPDATQTLTLTVS